MKVSDLYENFGFASDSLERDFIYIHPPHKYRRYVSKNSQLCVCVVVHDDGLRYCVYDSAKQSCSGWFLFESEEDGLVGNIAEETVLNTQKIEWRFAGL